MITLVAVALSWANFSAVAGEETGKTKVSFGYMGPVSDEGWTWSHEDGRKAVDSALSDKVETVGVENISYFSATRTFQQFVTDGAKLVIMTGELDLVKKVV